MTAVDLIESGRGEELLKRLPFTMDVLDWPMEAFLPGQDAMTKAYKETLSSFLIPKSQKHFNTAVYNFLTGYPPPIPPDPAPTPSGNAWWDSDDPILDQGNTGHCVGYTGADLRNALPFDNHVLNDEGHRLYYLCKDKDGEPGQENGSYVRTMMKVLVDLKIITGYANSVNIDTLVAFVDNQGPVPIGIGWTDSMFTPDNRGLVVPSGDDVGGHAICVMAIDHANEEAVIPNHWGVGWADNGVFRMKLSDLESRLKNGGEAWAAVQVS